jgi:catechol 2,3-dioxygenase-like lactoylglutathione lyase family enzyme
MTSPSAIPEPTASGAATVPLRFEVTVIPVSEVDRAKDFYCGLGWRLDADFPVSETYRVVQFTPPGSPASIQFGTGMTDLAPGSITDLLVAVDDLDAAREELTRLGADVSDTWHGKGVHAGPDERAPGPDPDGTSYRSYASFSDPDGNRWLLYEVTQRIPGRV